MGRKRTEKNIGLPANLYRRMKRGKFYYEYKDPITGETTTFGTDQATAFREAGMRNLLKIDLADQLRKKVSTSSGLPSIRAGTIDELGLYERASIVRASKAVSKVCGVYFLVRESTIIYVGQSTDVLSRISFHTYDSKKVFTSFTVQECDSSELDRMEALYISKFKPPLNKVNPKLKEYRPDVDNVG